MTIGVGGSTQGAEFERLRALRRDVEPIGDVERRARIAKAQSLMREKGVHALYLGSSSSMFYFTGVQFNPTERLHGALIPQEGDLVYLSPAFEEAKLRTMMSLPGEVRCWEEHEDPTALVVDVARDMGYSSGVMGVDPSTPFFTFDGLRRAGNSYDFINGNAVITQCRMIKSDAEIALIKRAMELTLEIQRSAASILREGVATTEISDFIKQAHTVAGFDAPPNFAMVLFGEPTAYPHGVPYPQTLKNGDMVLIDVGAKLKGYQSDITRSYVFGEPNKRQRDIWNVEKAATEAVFAAAQIGATCESLDAAARKVLEASGLGPAYALPGLPHRTGHGVGLDVHEEPYIVRGDRTKLAAGMCFSNEPTICIYGEFGVRLEDHIYMTEAGPEWFTTPSPSIDDPFGRQT